jgi:putative addiction module killer protein
MNYKVKKTIEYDEWVVTQSAKSQVQITKRLSKIEQYGHFGIINDVDDGVWELKWKNGRRVYYVYIPESKILLLIGGNKNGQDYDIAQAKKILKKYAKNET